MGVGGTERWYWKSSLHGKGSGDEGRAEGGVRGDGPGEARAQATQMSEEEGLRTQKGCRCETDAVSPDSGPLRCTADRVGRLEEREVDCFFSSMGHVSYIHCILI